MKNIRNFSEQMRDVPMELGQQVFPLPDVMLPQISLPQSIPSHLLRYSFEAEHRARRQYDERNNVGVKLEENTSGIQQQTLNNVHHSPINGEILVPSRFEPTHVTPGTKAPEITKAVMSFEEFESKGNVFDEVEWKSINDREALSQILSMTSLSATPASHTDNSLSGTSSHASTTPAPAVDAPSNLPYAAPLQSSVYQEPKSIAALSYPSLGYGYADSPVNSKSQQRPTSVPTVDRTATERAGTSSTASSGSVHANLRTKLITKGYRENLVGIALNGLPKERLVHIEFYIKGMSLLEKRGVNPDQTFRFLVDSKITDKQAIVNLAGNAEQLVSMGFEAGTAFETLLSCNGDRVKALEKLLGS